MVSESFLSVSPAHALHQPHPEPSPPPRPPCPVPLLGYTARAVAVSSYLYDGSLDGTRADGPPGEEQATMTTTTRPTVTTDLLGLPYASRRSPVMAVNGVVATSQPLAAQAGL